MAATFARRADANCLSDNPDQDEPNIDDLLTIVTESVAAYQVCKKRIDAVDAALKAALESADVDGSAGAHA